MDVLHEAQQGRQLGRSVHDVVGLHSNLFCHRNDLPCLLCIDTIMMEEDTAADLMQEIVRLTAQLNVIADKVEGVSPEAERLVMRRHIGNLMAAFDENLYRPILKQYPELDPHR